MALNPNDYPFKQLLTGSAPTASNSGQLLLITEQNVAPSFWDHVANGGGDIRFCENEDGTNQLAIDVVLCDTVAKTLRVLVRKPLYSTTSREVRIFSKDGLDSQPPASNAYGRETALQDYARAWFAVSGDDDRTGNTAELLGAGGFPDTVNNFWATGDVGRTITTKADLSAWTGYSSTTRTLVDYDVSGNEMRLEYNHFSSGRRFRAYMDTGFGATIDTYASPTYTSDADFDGVHLFQFAAQPSQGVKLKVSKNGTSHALAKNTGTSNNINNSDNPTIGNAAGFDYEYFLVRNTFLSDSYIELESANFNDPANFWTQSIPVVEAQQQIAQGAPAGVNLLVNGSFESPVITDNNGNYQHYTGSQVTGWQIIGDIDLVNESIWAAAEGSQSMDLNGTNAGAITQTVTGLTPKGNYNLSLMYAIHAYAGTTSRSMEILVNGEVIDTVTTSELAPNYQFTDYNIRADVRGEITVRFNALTTGTDMGMVLDKVSLVEVAALHLINDTKSLTVDGTSLPFLAKVNYASNLSKCLWARDVDGTPVISEVAENRYFTPFTRTSNTQIKLSSPVTLTGDFEVELYAYRTGTHWGALLCGPSTRLSLAGASLSNRVRFHAPGGSPLDTPAESFDDKPKLKKVIVKRVGSTASVSIDDGPETTGTVSGEVVFDSLGYDTSGLGGTDALNGMMVDVKIWDGGNRDTGTLVLDMFLDAQYGSDVTVENKVAVTQPLNINTDSNAWNLTNATVEFFGDTVRVTNTANDRGIAQLVFSLDEAPSGEDYQLIVSGKNTASSDGEMWLAPPFKSAAVNGVYYTTSTGTMSLNIRCNSYTAGEYIEFDMPKLTRLISGVVGTAINFVDADSELYTFDANGYWVSGVNTWTLGDYTSTGSEGAYVQTLGDQSVTIGHSYVTSLTASGFTSGEMRYRQDTDKLIISADGNYTSAPFTATTTHTRVRTGEVQPNAGATFSNISVKRVLEY